MSALIIYLSIFILGAIPMFEAIYVVPIAILGGTNFLLSLVSGLAGNFLSVLIVVIFSEKVKNWFMKNKESRRSQRAEGVWKRFGFYGFILLGPVVIGTHISAIAAISFGASKTKSMFYITLSMLAWSVALSVLAYYGVDFLNLEDMQFLQEYLN